MEKINTTFKYTEPFKGGCCRSGLHPQQSYDRKRVRVNRPYDGIKVKLRVNWIIQSQNSKNFINQTVW